MVGEKAREAGGKVARCSLAVAVDRRLAVPSEAEEASADDRGPEVQKVPQGPSMLHTFLSFSVVSLFVDCTN